MTSLKTLMCIAIISLITSCGSSKQTSSAVINDNPDRGAQKEARQNARQQLLADLNLREDQKKEVQAIVKESQEQIQELRNLDGDRRAKFQRMRDVRLAADQKLKVILDSEQYKIYETYKEKQIEQMREQTPNRGGRRG